MTATIYIIEANGAESITENITNCNFGTQDAPNVVTATYPIVAGFNGYEKYWKMKFYATFNKVDNLKFYKSAGTLDGGATLYSNCVTGTYASIAFAAPVTGNSSKATILIFETEPATVNLGISSSLSGSIVAASGTSDYICCQYRTTAGHTPGDIASLTLKFQYDEQ